VQLLTNFSGASVGLSPATANTVRIFLNTTAADICSTCDQFQPPSICEKWATAAKVSQENLLKGAVGAVFTALVAPNATTRAFFDGSVPCNSRDFIVNFANQAALAKSLVAFFGQPGVLGCSDADFPLYTGNPNMEQVHQNMPITKEMFDFFVSALVKYVKDNLATAVGPSLDADITQVAGLFASTGVATICNQPGCPTRGAYVAKAGCITAPPPTTTTTAAPTTVGETPSTTADVTTPLTTVGPEDTTSIASTAVPADTTTTEMATTPVVVAAWHNDPRTIISMLAILLVAQLF